MLNNRREKLLAISFGAILLLTLGADAVQRAVLDPVDELHGQVAAANKQKRQLELDFQVIEHAQRNLQALASQSLPADPSLAALGYQEWLLGRLQEAGITDPIVTPNQPIKEKTVGHRIPFTIQASASPRQFGKFLDDFHRAPLLHRITFASINNQGNPTATKHSMTFSVDALALSNGPDQWELSDIAPSHRDSSPRLEHTLARQDPFRRIEIKPTRTAPAVQPKPTHREPEIDELATVRLVAIVWDTDHFEAWFYDDRTKREHVLTRGEALTFGDFRATIDGITSESVTVTDTDAKTFQVALGATLRQQMSANVASKLKHGNS